MQLYGVDRVMLREIANGLSTLTGGRLASFHALMSVGLVTGVPAMTSAGLAFNEVQLTDRGHTFLHRVRTEIS